MENGTYRFHILKIEGLRVTQQSAYPVFVLLFLVYLFIMVSNLGLIALISLEKTLHKPMYLLFCNLPLNDVLGASIVIPGLLKDIFIDESDRHISYVACVIQAYGIHMFSTSAHTILMIMAFDRLSIRLSHCHSTISNPFCDNPSLFKLSCENLLVNNVYGLISSAVLWGTSIACIGLTYLRIATVCVKSRNRILQSKAMKTCSTHLSLYLIILGCGVIAIILHRFPAFAEIGKVASIMFLIIPTSLNPLIYGFHSKEIRQRLFSLQSKNKMNYLRYNELDKLNPELCDRLKQKRFIKN
ncbi:olfactory receptor-like protein COR2 [Salminus brasiliensis]|uniref:olfactory receptor-like protein COR2 n=1 Tax=Salminus brasiliensis TaxID=930266 RepID=UPI003B82E188